MALPPEIYAKILRDSNDFLLDLATLTDICPYMDVDDPDITETDSAYMVYCKIMANPDKVSRQVSSMFSKVYDRLDRREMSEEDILKTMAEIHGGQVKALVAVSNNMHWNLSNDFMVLEILLYNNEYDLAETYIKLLSDEDILHISQYMTGYGLNVDYNFLSRFMDQPRKRQLLIMELLSPILDYPIFDILTADEFEVFKDNNHDTQFPVVWFYKSRYMNTSTPSGKHGYWALRLLIQQGDKASIRGLVNSLSLDDMINDPSYYAELMYAISRVLKDKDLLYAHLDPFLSYYGSPAYKNLNMNLVWAVIKYGVDENTPRSIILLYAIYENISNELYPEFRDLKRHAFNTRDFRYLHGVTYMNEH